MAIISAIRPVSAATIPVGSTLIITTADGTTHKLKIDESLQLTPDAEADELRMLSDDLDMTLHLSDVTSLGYMVSSISASIDLPATAADSGQWRIYDLGGALVRSGDHGEPDLAGLKRGAVYVIVAGSETQKYIAL